MKERESKRESKSESKSESESESETQEYFSSKYLKSREMDTKGNKRHSEMRTNKLLLFLMQFF